MEIKFKDQLSLGVALATAAENSDKLKVIGLKEGRFTIRTRSPKLYIERFGGLIKHVMHYVSSLSGQAIMKAYECLVILGQICIL